MNPIILRRVQMVLLVIGLVITVMAGVLVAGCYRNDRQIDSHEVTVMADVVSADRLHANVYFQTTNGDFHSPRLGLLYPTELTKGQRISVEFDATNPDLARPAGRSASLSIIPAISIAILGWLIVGAVMVALALINRRITGRVRASESGESPDQDATTVQSDPDTTTA